MANSGYRTISYENGHSRRMDTAVRQNILTGIKDITQQIQRQVGQELSTDGYEMSAKYARFSKAVRLPVKDNRVAVAGFRSIRTMPLEKQANTLYNKGDTDESIKAYLRDKLIIDALQERGVKIIQRVDKDQFIVDVGKPKIAGLRKHAAENMATKPDRENMTQKVAQGFVDNSKLTVYQADRDVLKFLSDGGYSLLNLDNELVTAVPQKWRKKYDKYINKG